MQFQTHTILACMLHALAIAFARFAAWRMGVIVVLVAGAAGPSMAAKTYTINADGTVTDPATSLTWKRCAEGQTWSGTTCTGAAATTSWAAAVALNGATFAGKSTWRLPSLDELKSIVDASVASPTIDRLAFPGAPSSTFWTGSLLQGNANNVSVVDFATGTGASYGVQSGATGIAVRLVSGGLISAPVCTLIESPPAPGTGTSSNLTAICPGATAYNWVGGTCAGQTVSNCVVTPTTTTTYTVVGSNATLSGSASTTVRGASCTATLSSSTASIGAAASSADYVVDVTSACGAWTATKDAAWITITSGASGTGNGRVAYSVAANTAATPRTGALTIGGKTYTVIQAAAPASVTGTYDGIYLWSDGKYLSLHQDGATMIATIYFNADVSISLNPASGGALPVAQLDIYDLLAGTVTGTTAKIVGTRSFGVCSVGYNFVFEADAKLTATRTSVSNTAGANAAGLDCTKILASENATLAMQKIAFGVPVSQPVVTGLFDGIYQWSTDNYLSLHQDGADFIVTNYFNESVNLTIKPASGGSLSVTKLGAFDLISGKLEGAIAKVRGTKFHRACNVAYDFTLNADGSQLTATRTSVTNTKAADDAGISCQRIVEAESAGATFTIPKLRFAN